MHDLLWSFVFPGPRSVWEQLRFASVHSAGTPGLLEHQGLPSQVLCPNLSGEALLQPLPHQDSAGGSPVPPRQTRPTSGDGHRVLLLQPLFLPHVSGHVLPGLVLVLRTPLPTRRAGPVRKEWSEIYIGKSWGGRAGDASEIMRLWIEYWVMYVFICACMVLQLPTHVKMHEGRFRQHPVSSFRNKKKISNLI